MDHKKAKASVAEFCRSREKVLTIPFDGMREDVSTHWHKFLHRQRFRFYWKSFILTFTRNMPSGKWKNALLRMIGVKIGKNVFIASSAILDPQFPELITIGDNAVIGMFTHIFTHEVTHIHIRLGKVTVGKNALIGCLASIRSGVHVGDNAVVAMEAFVTEDIPFQTLVTGEPAQQTRKMHSIV